MSEEYVIGLDLGGTKIAAALCDKNGNILHKIKTETDSASGKSRVIQKIKDSIKAVMNDTGVGISRVSAIGLCAPGPLNVARGTIVYIATMDWEDVPITKLIYEEFGLPVYLEKDCNAAAFGELHKGAGRGTENLIYVTVSTGVGSGIIIGQRVYRGKHDFAGEFGHICLEEAGRKCSCGNLGCLQAYASGTAVAEIAREQALKEKTQLQNYIRSVRFSSEDVANAAREDDALAIKIWRDMGMRLGQGLSVLLQMFDPERIIIGGSVTKAWDLFFGSMAGSIKRHAYRQISDDMFIVPAMLGEDAGIIGAALLAYERNNRIEV